MRTFHERGVGTPVNYVQFNTTYAGASAEGRLYWDATDGTLAVGMPGGNVHLQIGQESILRAVNKTGSDLLNGQVVYINGAQGQRPTIALAKANSELTSAHTIAMLTEDIANNNNGYVTTFGLVRDVNTSGYSNGDTLYLSPTTSGGLTITKPTAPNHLVTVGYCVHSDATAGIILVNISNGYELDELHDVSALSPTDKDILRYKTSTGLWEKSGDLTSHENNTSNPHSTSDANLVVSDIATNNVSTLKHGFAPKLPGSATQFFNGQGNYVTISGTGVPSGYSAVTFSGQTSINVVHNFGIKPLVQVLLSGVITVPFSITHNTDNDFTVVFSSPQSGTIISSAGSPSIPNITTTATNYTIVTNDNIVQVTAFNKTITLPTAVGIDGKTYSIVNLSTGDIFVVGTSSQTILGETRQTVPSKSTMVVYSDGANWGIT